MRGTERITHDSMNVNTSLVDDALKGLLRDKGILDAERDIRIVQRKILCIHNSMIQLVNDQRESARAAGCECMDLYLATNHKTDKLNVNYDGRAAIPELVIDELKSSFVIEWRAKNGFALTNKLGRTGRVYPFDAGHSTHKLIFDYVNKTSPSYYKVLAAYETARLTLNYALKAMRKIALDVHRNRVEAEGLPMDLFTKETAKLSRAIIASTDKSGQLEWILQGLYFEM